MGLGARLVAYGYVGEVSPSPFTLDLRATKNSGLIATLGNVTPLTDDEGAPFVLAYRTSFPDTENQDSQWSDGSSNTYRAEVPAAFKSTINALQHELSDEGTSVEYTSTFTDTANQAFAFRGQTAKAPKELVKPILAFGRGDWLFRFVDGSGEVALKSDTWTQSLQDDLDALLQLDGYDTQIDEMRADIYAFYQSLSGSISEGEQFELIVIVEPGVALNAWVDKNHTRIATPFVDLDENFYDTGAYTVRGNGLSFMWQYGYPLFASEGTVKRRFQHLQGFSGETFTTQADETLSGTDVTGTIEVAAGSTLYDVVLTLETSNTRHTPFVYGSQVTIPGGEYAADSATPGTPYWDSDDFPGVIEDVSFSCDGELLENCFDVRIKDINGAGMSSAPLSVLTSSWHYQALENRRATLSIDGGLQLTLGLVTKSARNSMKAATPDQPLSDVVNPQTKVTPEIRGGWALMDEQIMRASPILDNKILGEALALVMSLGGWPDVDIAGIDTNLGPLIKPARFGEEAAMRPREGQTLGDLVRELLERRGLGLIFFQDYNGVWQLQARPTTLIQVSGMDAAFVRNSVQANSATTYPGRLAVLEEFDMMFDTSNFYNVFNVEGALKPDGTRICRQRRIEESISNSSDLVKPSKLYIGREKPYPTVKDESLRDEDDVEYCLRSLVERFGRVPRFGAFRTYYHQELYVGGLISKDGPQVRIARLSGSTAADRMDLVYQELA